jgi:hypothetical protein
LQDIILHTILWKWINSSPPSLFIPGDGCHCCHRRWSWSSLHITNIRNEILSTCGRTGT